MKRLDQDAAAQTPLNFAGVVGCLALVGDGWSGRPHGIVHQLLLLPMLGLFVVFLWRTLHPRAQAKEQAGIAGVCVLLSFQLATLALFLYEAKHFRGFGYRLSGSLWGLVAAVSLTLVAVSWRWRGRGWPLLAGGLVVSLLGTALSIWSFPLNYLRSDMLPVIVWADTQWLHHVDPYVTMHVGNRTYDFPYLPGMLVAYLPFVFLGFDLRTGAAAYLCGAMLLLWGASSPKARPMLSVLIAIFLLDPFLQYRHELYLQPHWFFLALAAVCLSRGVVLAGCFAFGISMGIYQFSWVAFPFVLLYLWRNGGFRRAAQGLGSGLAGMLVVMGPLLPDWQSRIAGNTVTQWGRVGRPFADPINLAYWVSFLVAPSHLLWVQAVAMIVLFVACVSWGRCQTLADTTRWIVIAVTLFVMLNVIVDGYFYLLVAFLLLIHLCFACRLLPDPGARGSRATAPASPEGPRGLVTGKGDETAPGLLAVPGSPD